MSPATAHPPWLSQGAVAVLGSGSALPGPPVTTEALIDAVEARFGGLRRRAVLALAQRMGIATRHVCRGWLASGEGPEPGRSNPELAAQAARAALGQAGIEARDIGYLIGHTATPAQPLPANIALVADQLGYGGPHLELRQACTGFANALMIAFGLLASPSARPVVIVGSETGSVFLDPVRTLSDSGQLVNLVQMGDGAGAVVLAPAAAGTNRLSAAWFGAVGLHKSPGLQMRSGGSNRPCGGDGPLEFDHDYTAIADTGRHLFEAGVAAARSQGIDLAQMNHIIPHQVSGRIGDQIADHFAMPRERFFVHADRVGNTGSAAIWLALDALRNRGIGPGERVLALGAEATKHMHGGFVYEQG